MSQAAANHNKYVNLFLFNIRNALALPITMVASWTSDFLTHDCSNISKFVPSFIWCAEAPRVHWWSQGCASAVVTCLSEGTPTSLFFGCSWNSGTHMEESLTCHDRFRSASWTAADSVKYNSACCYMHKFNKAPDPRLLSRSDLPGPLIFETC